MRVPGIVVASRAQIENLRADKTARQVAATLSGHVCHLYSVELTESEMDKLKADKSVHGENDEEKTYIEVMTVGDLLTRPVVDWSMVGMVLSGRIKIKGNPFLLLKIKPLLMAAPAA